MTASPNRRARRSKGEHVSPSQIGTYDLCPRRWGYKAIEGLSEPPGPYEQEGLDVHEGYEHWFKHKKVPSLNTKAGLIIAAGLKHYPAPSPELKVEHEARFEFDGVEYLMYLDLHYPSPGDPRELTIDDHKTTADLKWAKTEEQLLVDPQRVLYAAWGTLTYAIDRVRTRWIYHLRKPPYTTQPAILVQGREEIWQAMEAVHAKAKIIKRARGLRIADLEQNFHACRAYNKDCAFMERCHAGTSATTRFSSIIAQAERAERARELGAPPPFTKPDGSERRGEGMSLLAKLRGGGAAPAGSSEAPRAGRDPAKVREEYDRQAAGSSEAPPEPSKVAGTITAAPSSGGGLLAKLRKGETPKPTEPEPEAEAGPDDGPSSGLLAELKAQAVEDQPEPAKSRKAKKNGDAEGPTIRIAIADERTARVVLHGIGIATGRNVEFVREHVTQALTPGK